MQSSKPTYTMIHSFEFEYLVKWKGVSYLHLDWMVAEDLECLPTRSKQLFGRYLKRLQQQVRWHLLSAQAPDPH